MPGLQAENVAELELLRGWLAILKDALEDLEDARTTISAVVRKLVSDSQTHRRTWTGKYDEYKRKLGEQLALAGVESPRELVTQVSTLQERITIIEKEDRPRLIDLRKAIEHREVERANLLARLERVDGEITQKRSQKVDELNTTLNGNLIITLNTAADRAGFKATLTELCANVATSSNRIQNRENQVTLLVQSLSPRELAAALQRRGVVQRSDDQPGSMLQEICGITSHTQTVICNIANDIEMINRLQTVPTPDVLHVEVRRRGETTYAPLRSGLSPGEQCAAILTLALQTRTRPLLLDQPEDELGYWYVVHNIVPKILRTKFTRQLLIVTHDANIPVLGDADYVIQMENQPCPDMGRVCVVAAEGCFESSRITGALMELEGGQQAFQLRKHRYMLPKA